MPNPNHIFDQQLIRKIEMHNIRADNMYFDRFLGIERWLAAPKDVRTEIYVATITDIIIYIRNGNGDQIQNLRAYTNTVLSNKYNRWQAKQMRDRRTIVFGDPAEMQPYELPDSCLDHEQKEKLMEMLKSLMRNLSERCQEIIKAKYTKGQRFRDIAVSLGYTNENSARGAHHTCIQNARELGMIEIERIFN